jgi:hypothetical protein
MIVEKRGRKKGGRRVYRRREKRGNAGTSGDTRGKGKTRGGKERQKGKERRA